VAKQVAERVSRKGTPTPVGAQAFSLFRTTMQRQIKEDNPTLTHPEIVALMSEAWKTMSPEDKQYWYDQTEARIASKVPLPQQSAEFWQGSESRRRRY